MNKILIIFFILIFDINKLSCFDLGFIKQNSINTPRLILRLLDLSHSNQLFSITSDADVAKLTSMFTLHLNLNETIEYIKTSLDKFEKGEIIPWIVFDKETNEVVGFVRFLDFSLTNLRGEIGYAFAKKYWNKGFATEASKALIEFGFKFLNLVRIQATVDPYNEASNRVLEKCNMKYEGLLHKYKITQRIACDRKMYAITRDEFFKL